MHDFSGCLLLPHREFGLSRLEKGGGSIYAMVLEEVHLAGWVLN